MRERPKTAIGGSSQTHLLLACVWALSLLPAQAQWAWPGYQARLVLDVEDQSVPTAALSFCFGGQMRPDGKDIRIVSVTGLPVKSQVLYCAPLGLSQLAFAPILGMRRYYVYFNNPAETNPPPEPWEPLSGLLLETRRAQGGRYFADALDDVKSLFQKGAGEVLGKMFVSTTFFGDSPFKADGEIVSYVKGFLTVTVEGEYTFATSSLDSTFALIDGKPVCQAPGAHDWTGGAHFKGSATLTKGPHVLEYYHIQRNNPMRAALVWKTPKGQGFEMIPPTAFTPVTPVKIVGFEKAGLPFAADFDMTRAGDVLRGDTQATLYQFKARSWGQEKPTSFSWDFGDGTKGTGETVEHAFFGLWEPKVELTMSKGAIADKFDRAVRILPAEGDVDENKVLPRVAEIVKSYSARDLEPKSATTLIQFLKGARLNQVFAHVIEQQLASPQGIPREKLDEYVPLLADAYLDDSQFAKALQRYDEQIQKTANAVAPEIRKARLRAAECCIHIRKFDEAIQRHQALMQTVKTDEVLTPVERGFSQDKVKAALKQGKYTGARDLLEEFILKNPSVLDNDTTFMLRARIAFGEKKWEAAATDFEFIEKLEPRSNYIPEALFLSGQCYVALSKPAEATKALERVVSRYGNSPFAETSKQELAKLKR